MKLFVGSNQIVVVTIFYKKTRTRGLYLLKKGYNRYLLKGTITYFLKSMSFSIHERFNL